LQPAYSPGAGGVFGGIRISLIDPEKIPNYVDKYEGSIRAHDRFQLEEHLIRANHPGGLNETLTDEDFGITMAWGLLSPTGLKMSPSSRGEGPIWYGIFPTLIELINVSHDPSNPGNWVHVINCYVNLINKLGRRSYLRQHPDARNEKDGGKTVKLQGQSPPYEDERGSYVGRGGYVAEEYISAEEDTLLEVATKATKRGQERTKKKKKLKSSRSPSIDGIKRRHQINNFWYFHRRLETRLQNGKRKDFRKFQNTKKELSVARKF
jgi:hypothetical protein